MGAEFDLVEHALQLGIGERLVAAADGDREAVERRARNAAREQPVAHLIEHVEQVLAMLQSLGPAVHGIVHALQRQDAVERGQRPRCGNGGRAGVARDAETRECAVAAARALVDAANVRQNRPCLSF